MTTRLGSLLPGVASAQIPVLTGRLGLPAAVQSVYAALADRWDGKGDPGRLKRRGHPGSG